MPTAQSGESRVSGAAVCVTAIFITMTTTAVAVMAAIVVCLLGPRPCRDAKGHRANDGAARASPRVALKSTSGRGGGQQGRSRAVRGGDFCRPPKEQPIRRRGLCQKGLSQRRTTDRDQRRRGSGRKQGRPLAGPTTLT